MDELHMWMISISVSVLLTLLGIWWRQVNKSDRKLDDLKRCNDKAHKNIHDKMDDLGDSLHKSIVDLWKHKK